MLKFRHLLEENDLTRSIFEEIGTHLNAKKLMMKEGSIVDATIINAPSSTNNAEGKRDPQMHQTRKGKQWHFGIKAHNGADADFGLAHSLVATAANVSDISQTEHLLHGQEKRVHADAGYLGVEKREEFEGSKIDWLVAAKRGKIKAMAEGLQKDLIPICSLPNACSAKPKWHESTGNTLFWRQCAMLLGACSPNNLPIQASSSAPSDHKSRSNLFLLPKIIQTLKKVL